MEKVAIIDCGTNTFHLMIASIEGSKFMINERIKTAVKIGEGGINQNRILDSGEKRALAALSNFKSIIDENQILRTFAYATSAFRNADNGKEIQRKIKNQIGLDLQIIDGNREAELIFKGVNLALDLNNETALVMDIGGGSVEFIIGNNDEILWKKSIEIGGQRLVELFHKHDPMEREEIEALENYLEKQLIELFDNLNKYKPKLLAGSSGTFDTLSEIHCSEQQVDFNDKNPENQFSIDVFDRIHKKLITFNRSERMQIPGMIEMRVDMIVVASCLINFILERYSFDNIRVSSYSLKEGALSELLM